MFRCVLDLRTMQSFPARLKLLTHQAVCQYLPTKTAANPQLTPASIGSAQLDLSLAPLRPPFATRLEDALEADRECRARSHAAGPASWRRRRAAFAPASRTALCRTKRYRSARREVFRPLVPATCTQLCQESRRG